MYFTGVHRGVLLTKSLDEQNKICHGILSPRSFIIKQIVWADEELKRMIRNPNMPRIHKSDNTIEIKKMVARSEVVAEKELFFICYAMKNDTSIPLLVYTFYVFSAFQTNVFHLGWQYHLNDEQLQVYKRYTYISMPAEKIIMRQNNVEEYYMRIRRVIGKYKFVNFHGLFSKMLEKQFYWVSDLINRK